MSWRVKVLCVDISCFHWKFTASVRAVIVKGNKAHFSFYRSGNMFYTVTVNGTKWMFPVSLEDIGGASLFAEMKAITLMRYIRKALEDKTFVKAA